MIDIDPRHGGIESMQQLVRKHGPLPTGPRVRTGSGGWHLLFADPGRSIRNSVSQVGPGIDVRADGGYVIAPPSMHAAGDRYLWSRVGQPTDMPDWLERLVDPPRIEHRAVTEPTTISASLDKWAAAALRGELERVRHAPDGCRNHTLNRAAFALGQIAGAGIIETSEVESQLQHAALGAGLGEREALLTIRSGISAGLARPRWPADTSPLSSPTPDVTDNLDVGLP